MAGIGRQVVLTRVGPIAPAPSTVDQHRIHSSEDLAPSHAIPESDLGTMPSRDTVRPPVLVSHISLGEGWWQGTDGNWYAPELYPSDTPKGGDWWQAATNGKWYPPMFHPSYASRSASDVSSGEGWWQGTDGKWYAPELHPSEVREAMTGGKRQMEVVRTDVSPQSPGVPDHDTAYNPGPNAEAGATTSIKTSTNATAPTGATAPTSFTTTPPPSQPSPSPPPAQDMAYAATSNLPPSAPTKNKRSLRLHWRKMTWAVVIFNILMLLWIIIASPPRTPRTATG